MQNSRQNQQRRMREKFRSSVTRWHCSMIRSLPGYSFREGMMRAEFKIQKRQKRRLIWEDLERV